MRVIYFYALFLINIYSFSQPMAGRFQKAINSGIALEVLDSIYSSALHDDSTKAVFHGKEKEFYAGYVSMLTELNSFLKKNDFFWSKKTRCFNRIYFNKEGKIDYFLFNFYPNQIEIEQESKFENLVSEFISTYQFPLTANRKFAQCSPVTYINSENK
jgi:hypothetical protein